MGVLKMLDFLKRYGILLLVFFILFSMLLPGRAEINTFLIIILTEIIAIALSALALFAYTRLQFDAYCANNNLGYIFLGVHICVGFTMLGTYLVQFS